MNKTQLDKVSLVLLIIGGLNWGLYAFGYDLVNMLFGAFAPLNLIVYVLVGLAAVYELINFNNKK